MKVSQLLFYSVLTFIVYFVNSKEFFAFYLIRYGTALLASQCKAAVGIGDGRIKDSQITASSYQR